jgi:hypothetical protein
MCDPCDELSLSADQPTVCVSVGEVASKHVVPETSLAVLREDLHNSMQFWVDDDDHVTIEMVNAALAAVIEVGEINLYANSVREPYTGTWTDAEVNE